MAEIVSDDWDDDGVEQTLDGIESLFGARQQADAGLFVAATRFADLRAGDSLRARRAKEAGAGGVLPGTERAVRLGGAGTPTVTEFCALELGARMQMGSWTARLYLADALDARHRLPLIWARLVAGEARVAMVRLVAARTRHLDQAAAAFVDAAMVEAVDGSIPWSRFETRLTGKIVEADPEAAAAREEERLLEQFAKRTHGNGADAGIAAFYIRSTVGVVARLDATVAFLAEALAAFGDPDTLDLRRVKAVTVLANPTRAVELLAAFAALNSHATDDLPPAPNQPPNAQPADQEADEEFPADQHDEASAPDDDQCDCDHRDDALARMDAFARRVGFTPTRLPHWCTGETEMSEAPVFRFDWSKLLPSLTLNLHLAAETVARDAGGVARWEGEGPVTQQFVEEHLRPLHSYRIQPVIDLPTMAPVDAYEVPDRHRRAVHLRTPADSSPFSSNLTTAVDIDHTEEYNPALASKAEAYWSTRLGNLAPLGRSTHRLKTFGNWTVRQPFNGIVVWRDPYGQVYLVDHTGTHKVTRPGSPAGPTATYDPVMEISSTTPRVELVWLDS